MTLQCMDFGLSATGQNTCCTQFRNRRHVASWGERGGGRGGYILGLSYERGGNFLKYPLPGRGKFFICLSCLKITDIPLGINNEQSLMSEEQKLCSPILDKRELYYLKGRVAACYSSRLRSASTSVKPVWRHRNRGSRKKQTEENIYLLLIWYCEYPRSLYNNVQIL